MNLSFFVVLSLSGVFLSALISFISAKGQGHRAVVTLLALSTGLGAFSSAAFLLSGQSQLTITQSAWLFGTPFVLSVLSALFFFLLNTVACLASVYAMKYVEQYTEVYNVRVLDGLMAIFVLGMQGVLLAGTPFGFLVFWEIMSLSSFFLVMADKEAASVRAALFYLIMTHLGAGAILAGFMILSNGSLLESFTRLAILAQHLPPSTLFGVFLLFLFGFGSKAGLVPFHVWLPEAHPQAPSHISALMSGVMLKMALYGFLVMTFTVLPIGSSTAALIVIALGLLSAVYGVIYAVIERDVKRVLAFSSIENMGIIFTMLGVAMLTQSQGMSAFSHVALGAALLFAIAHAFFKSGLFMGAGVMVHAAHSRSLEVMGGLSKRMPAFSGAMLILALAAAALPPFSAFMAEWTFVQNLVANLSTMSPFIQGVLVLVLVTMALVGGLALFAMIKLFGIGFLAEPRSEHVAHAKAPGKLIAIPIYLLAACSVLVGLLAPAILRTIGYGDLTVNYDLHTNIVLGGGSMNPGKLLALLVATFFLVLLLRRVLSNVKHEREYHTWDCGQPITPGMEFTATAFSASIRFFFRVITRTKKNVITTPIIASNPWIASRTFSLELRQIWYDDLYVPIQNACLWTSTQVRKLQNGVIQFYIALIFIALVVTLAIAL
ncbi:MAG: proton-conducting transporter membrane subunit [Candidatus Uhrbacteria bacterium]|nr:proton-conducting transporter membrane subunit [Candidatus Uhrbacteria bacterium]